MRVIAGRFRGRRLKTPPDSTTRPTSDRLRETLFNVLAPRMEASRFLDLCAGTGAVGIEALSRGVLHVTFVDQSRKLCGLIESNLELTQVEQSDYDVVASEALDYLRHHEKKGEPPFDLIFFDPPYAMDYDAVLKVISEGGSTILNAGGVVIVEHYKKKALADRFNALTRYRELKQGDSVLSFYRIA